MTSRTAGVFAGVALAVLLGGCNHGPDAPVGQTLATKTSTISWSTPYGIGVQQTTEHYRIYSTVSSEPLRSLLPGFMEAAYRHYLDLTGLADRAISRKMPLYMLATRQQWAHFTTLITKEAADVYLNIEAGGYCHQGVCVFWDIGSLGSFSIAAHEGLHQLLAHRMAQPLPSWLEEGLCVTAEGYDIQGDAVQFTPQRNVLRFTHLREAIVNGRGLALQKLLTMDSADAVSGWPETATGYYGQLWALSLYLRSSEQYRTGLARLLEDAEKGRLNEELGISERDFRMLLADGKAYNRRLAMPLFRKYVTDDLAGCEKGYLAFARRLAGLEER